MYCLDDLSVLMESLLMMLLIGILSWLNSRLGDLVTKNSMNQLFLLIKIGSVLHLLQLSFRNS